MLQDTIDEYNSKREYHNLLVSQIDYEMFFYDGQNPIKRVRDLKKEISALEKYLPVDVVKNAVPLLEWNAETMAKLDPDLRKSWLQMEAQVQKIKDFAKMYGYINHKYPNYNCAVVMITMSTNLGKICRNYVKHSNDDTKEVFDELKDIIKNAQLSKPTKAQLNDHEGFKALQEKYPHIKFDEVRELSQAEKDVAHLRADIVVGKRPHVNVQDEKTLKQREKALKTGPDGKPLPKKVKK